MIRLLGRICGFISAEFRDSKAEAADRRWQKILERRSA